MSGPSMHRLSESDVVVTTTHSPSPGLEARAAALARQLEQPLVTRRKQTIHVLTRREGVDAALVVGDDGLRLVYEERSYRFHPGMARHRISALRAGRGDRLAKVADLQSGDAVLDCTCGLGADAIVAAHVVGESGSVEAIESSAVLAAIAAQGMKHYHHGFAALVRAMQLVSIINSTYETFLPSLPTKSREVVYFDPMFASTIDAAKGLDLVRLFGSTAVPSREALVEARRVARRCVVVKDRAPGRLLYGLDIPAVSRTQRVWYGRLEAS